MTADQVYHLAGKGHVAYQSILLIKANLLAIVGSLTRAGIAIARVSLVHGRWRRGPLRPVWCLSAAAAAGVRLTASLTSCLTVSDPAFGRF